MTLLGCLVYYTIELVDTINYEQIPMANFRNTPLVIGVGMYSFEAIGSLLNIRLSMKKIEKFPKY